MSKQDHALFQPDYTNPGRVRRLAGWVHRHELLILALCAPAVLFIRPALAPMLLVLPLLWLCRWLASGRFVPPGRLNAPLLLLLCVLLINLFVTPDIHQSLPKIGNLLFGIALCVALIDWAVTPRRRQWLLHGVLALGLLLVLVALFATHWPQTQKFSVGPFNPSWLTQVPRYLHLPGAEGGINPNEVGGVLVIFAPFSAMLVLHEARRPKRSYIRMGLYLTAFICLGLLTLMTQSRSAVLGMATGLASLVAWKRWYGRVVLAAPLVILIGLAVTGQLEPLLVQSGLIRDTAAISTLNGRLLIWQRAGYFLAQAPFTGIGLNQFRLAVPAFWPLASPLLHGDIGHAHNHFVHVAVEMGIPGLIAYAAIWLAALRQVWAGLHTRCLPEFEMALLGSASSLVAFLVYGVFDTVALGARAGFPFWLFLALVFALTMPPAANEPPTV